MRKLAIVAAIVAAAALAGPASAQDSLEQEAHDLMIAFTEAVMSGPDAVAGIIAPEYQIMRSNGVGYDHDGYIASVGAVDIQPDYAYEDLVATGGDDLIVIRSILTVNETIDGTPITRRAPRLTVFRKIDGEWKVVAHGNFAQVGDEN